MRNEHSFLTLFWRQYQLKKKTQESTLLKPQYLRKAEILIFKEVWVIYEHLH